MNLSILENYGIDKNKGMANCMNDEAFYASMLSMFLQQTALDKALTAYANHDRKGLFEAAHEIKGISGSTGMTALYNAASRLVEQLRSNDADINRAEISVMFRNLEQTYTRACRGIRLALE